MKRGFEMMPVTSDEEVRILGPFNIEDVESQKASRIRAAIRSIKLYFDFDHRDVTSRR